MKRVVIVGGGISGLVAAWRLQSEAEVTLIEASNRLGGHIRTAEEEGFLFERGPRGIRPKGRGMEVVALMRELDLEGEIIHASPVCKKRYLLRQGKLECLTKRKWPLIRGMLRDWWKGRPKGEDCSLLDFFLDRFGSHGRELAACFSAGIFAGDPSKISLRSGCPLLWERGFLGMRKVPGLKSPLLSLKGGMESLCKRLAERLTCEVQLQRRVNPLEIEADMVLSCIPYPKLAPLATVAVVNVGYEGNLCPVQGFGYLVPDQEDPLLGVVFDSEVFPQQNRGEQTRLTAMVGGSRWEGAWDQEEIKQFVLRRLRIDHAPAFCHVTIAKRAIPHYPLNYHKEVEEFRKTIPPNVHLLGNSFVGVAVNDCVAVARKIKLSC